jgi:succinoglycan biosynthesis transport protein ExoP
MADNGDRILHFNEYFKIIRNRLWVIFTIFALTVLSGLYVTEEVIPKKYTATSSIQIRPRSYDVSGIESSDTQPGQFSTIDFQAEFQIMQSANVLMPIISDLQLDKVWAKRLKAGVDALSPQNALAHLNGILKLDFQKGTNIINITVTSEVPKECMDVANDLANRYKTSRDVEEDERVNRGTQVITDQITQQQAVVDKQRAAVEKMRTDLANRGIDIPSTGAVKVRSEDDLESRKRDLLQAQEDYDARRVLLESVIKLPDDQFISTLAGLGREEPAIGTLVASRLKLESDMDNLLKSGFGPDNPRITSMQGELVGVNQQITDAVAGLRRAMTVDTDMAKSRVDLLTAEVEDLDKRVLNATTNGLVPFRDMQQDLDQKETVLNTLNLRLKQINVSRELQQSPVRIVSLAVEPEYPSQPNKNENMVVSVLAGLFVGVAVAFLIEYLDTSVKTMADAESLLGLPVLTVIPNKGGPMPLIQDSGRLPHAEGYRILRAKLDLKVQNGIGPSLTMLSGGPGEGKSTTIYNLAVICAQAGQSVILIDCDLRRPTLHDLLGVSNERGLSNYLRGEGEAVAFVQRTAIPKLQVLTAGNMPMSEIGVLAGDKIRNMLDDLKQRYDLVLIDAPPVLGISDGSIIAREVDYVILVIQHRRYPREISLRAKRAIEEVHGNCVGMVLNCVAVKSDDSYYYYSNYGNYYKKKPKKRKDMVVANGKPVATAGRKTNLDSEEF